MGGQVHLMNPGPCGSSRILAANVATMARPASLRGNLEAASGENDLLTTLTNKSIKMMLKMKTRITSNAFWQTDRNPGSSLTPPPSSCLGCPWRRKINLGRKQKQEKGKRENRSPPNQHCWHKKYLSSQPGWSREKAPAAKYKIKSKLTFKKIYYHNHKIQHVSHVKRCHNSKPAATPSSL